MPLNIALPISSFLPSLGGAEVGLHNIAIRLMARGHNPTVIAPAPHLAMLRRASWNLPYPVVSFPPKIWGIMRHAPSIGHALFDAFLTHLQRRHRFDIWHATIGYPVGVNLVRYARTRQAIPHLVRCTGEDIQVDPDIGYGMRLNPEVDRQVRQWLPRADCLVAITESVAREYSAIGAKEAIIARIPNGVDVARFQRSVNRAAIRNGLGIAPDTTLLLCVGRNHPKKDFDILLQAVERGIDAGTDIAAVFVGKGVTELASRISRETARKRILLIEPPASPTQGADALLLPSDRLIDIYKSADAFVLPSRIETFGIVLVEAMAAGLPVITTDAPGCRDVVRAEQDGIVVPVGDVAALSAAILNVAGSPALRDLLSKAARRRADDFSWDTIVDQYIALYGRLIAAHQELTRKGGH